MTHYRFVSRRRVLGWALGSGLGALASSALPAWAAPLAASVPSPVPADWPGRQTIKVIVPGAPGGLADNMMRFFLADRLSVALGTIVEVENQPGAGGVAGMAALAKAAPDGCTLAFADVNPFLLMSDLNKMPYDPARDFAPVASVFAHPVLLLATPALSRQDAPDLPALLSRAKQKPGAIRWAAGAATSMGHLILEQIKTAAGVDIALAPYVSDDQQIADALAGKFEVLALPSGPAIVRQIKAGQFRPLAVAAPSRLREELPGVPTLAELGLSSANLSSLFGFFAPEGTPLPIVQKLSQVIGAQSGDAEVRHHIDAESLVALRGSAVDFSRSIDEMAGYTRAALTAAGIRAG